MERSTFNYSQAEEMPEEIKHKSSAANIKNRESVFEQNTVLFPKKKKRDQTEIARYYVMEERNRQEKS